MNVDGRAFRAVLYFKKHLNNTQATAPPNKLKWCVSEGYRWSGDAPKGWTGNFPESLSAQSMTNHGHSFQL